MNDCIFHNYHCPSAFLQVSKKNVSLKAVRSVGAQAAAPSPWNFFYFMSTSLETTIPIGLCQICSIFKFHLSEYTKISCLSSIIKRNSLPGKIARFRFNAFISLVPKGKILTWIMSPSATSTELAWNSGSSDVTRQCRSMVWLKTESRLSFKWQFWAGQQKLKVLKFR